MTSYHNMSNASHPSSLAGHCVCYSAVLFSWGIRHPAHAHAHTERDRYARTLVQTLRALPQPGHTSTQAPKPTPPPAPTQSLGPIAIPMADQSCGTTSGEPVGAVGARTRSTCSGE